MQNTVGTFREISKTWNWSDIITLDYVKQSLGLTEFTTNFDAKLTNYIKEAIAIIHRITNSYILPATVEVSLNGFHNLKIIYGWHFLETNYFIINKNRIREINSIEYKDIENNLQTLASDKYILDTSSQFYTKILSKDDFFPRTYTLEGRTYNGNVVVNFNCGLFADVNDFNNSLESAYIINAIEKYVQSRFEECSESESANNIKSDLSYFRPISYTVYE